MATQRLVNTNFWKDTYVIDLDPIQKLLFLYFLTNPRTSLAGVYEISLREAAFDTGIDRDMVQKILDKFCQDGKMYYERGWIVLRNFVKHQRLNPSVKQGIDRVVAELPTWLRDKVEHFSSYYDQQRLELESEQAGDSLATDSPQDATPNLTKPNLTKPNLKTHTRRAQAREIVDFYNQAFERQIMPLDERLDKIVTRLRTFSTQQIKQAITNASHDDFFNGSGSRGWTGDLDFLIRDNKNLEKYLSLIPKPRKKYA